MLVISFAPHFKSKQSSAIHLIKGISTPIVLSSYGAHIQSLIFPYQGLPLNLPCYKPLEPFYYSL